MTNSTSDDPGYPSTRSGYYVTFVLLAAYTLSFIDRQILGFMVDPVKRDLHLSDTSVSLLHGFAFAIFYTAVGLFLGRFADRYNRRRLIILGVTFWCAATIACGFADNYWELFAARVLVGVGEATLSPAAYSIIADYFPRPKRARPIGIYSAGVYIGSGLAFIVGGAVIQATGTSNDFVIIGLGQFHSWQLAFIIVGLPGLLMVPLLLTIREPMRHDVEAASPGLRYFVQHRGFYLPAMAGFAVLAIVTFAYTAWLPTSFVRTWGWSPGQIGLAYGLTMLAAGAGGMVSAGWFSDRMIGKGRLDAPITLSIKATLAAVPVSGALAFTRSPEIALTLVAITTFLASVSIALAPTAFQSVTPNQLRGQSTALYLLLINLIGMGCGPTLVALVTDFWFDDEGKVLLSVAIVCTAAILCAAGLIALSLRPYRSLRGNA
jgi:MFS family permease